LTNKNFDVFFEIAEIFEKMPHMKLLIFNAWHSELFSFLQQHGKFRVGKHRCLVGSVEILFITWQPKRFRRKKNTKIFLFVNYGYFSELELARVQFHFKGRVHCFSMQVVMNKRFPLHLEKKLAQIRLVIFE